MHSSMDVISVATTCCGLIWECSSSSAKGQVSRSPWRVACWWTPAHCSLREPRDLSAALHFYSRENTTRGSQCAPQMS